MNMKTLLNKQILKIGKKVKHIMKIIISFQKQLDLILRRTKNNQVLLTPQEHFRCHELLPYIYKTGSHHRKMVYAWHMMRNSNKKYCVIIDANKYALTSQRTFNNHK